MAGTFDGRLEHITFPAKSLRLTLTRNSGGGRSVRTDYLAATGDDPVMEDEQVERFEDWSGGACVSQDIRPEGSTQPMNVYATGSFITSRDPHYLMPSGALMEVPVLLTSGGTVITPGYPKGSLILGGSLFVLMGRYIVRIHNGDEDILGVGTLDGLTVSDISHPTVNGGLDLGSSATASDAVLFSSDDGQTYGFVGTEGVGSNAVLWRLTTSTSGVASWSQATGLDAPRLSKLGVAYQMDIQDSAARGNLRLFGLLNANTTVSDELHYAYRSFIFCQEPNDPLQPIADVWSAGYRIGGGRYDCRKIVASGSRVMFLCENGIHDVNILGHSPNVTTYWENQLGPQNGNCGVIVDGKLLAAHARGLDSYTIPDGAAMLQQRPGYCGPGVGLPNETNIYGPPWEITFLDGYAVGAFFNGTDSFVMIGRPKAGENLDAGSIIWTGPEAVLLGQKVTHMRPYDLGAPQPRLLICSVDSATESFGRIYWQSLPEAQSGVQEYLNNRSASGAYTGTHRWAKRHSVTQTASAWGRQATRKVLVQTRLRSDQLSTDTYYRAFVSAEGQVAYQQGSGPEGSIIDPRATIRPRTQLLPSQSLASGHNLQLRLDGVAPDAAEPPNGSGLVSSATTTTLTDDTQTSETWSTNIMAGYRVRIVDGTATGQFREIISNTSDTLTVSPAFTTTPTEGDEYQIEIANQTGALASATTTALPDTTKSWTVNQWTGFVVELESARNGDEISDSRVIVSNTAHTLTVSPAFATAPADGTRYRIGRGYTIRPPILRGAEMVAEEIVETRAHKTYTAIFGPLQEGNTTSRMQVDPYVLLDRVIDLHRAPPTILIDENGKRVYARVIAVRNIVETEWKRQSSDSNQTVLQAEITVSIVPSTVEELGIGTPNARRNGSGSPGSAAQSLGFKWNSGYRWNSGRKWG